MKEKTNKKRVLLAVLAAIAVAALATTGVLAYMFRHQGSQIDGQFEAQELTCEVVEEYDPDTGIKSSIKVKNGSNGDCYLRLNLVSYWQDGDGNVVMGGVVGKPSKLPTIEYDIGHWLKDPDHDIYYYKSPVAPGETTKDLLGRPITLVTDTWDNGETVYQVVEVFAETVQASPAAAVVESWGMNVGVDGRLSFPATP
ncbi:MAG: hypothetical protein MJ083_05360 [Clostridia bacterium]|nr:hypothetical protein [Clostridia bacterium]